MSLIDTKQFERKLFNGQWVKAGSGVPVREPATGETLFEAGLAGKGDVAAAAKSARAAQRDWAARPHEQRSAIFRKAADLFEQHAEAVTPLLMISEVGFYSQRPLVQFILSGIFERFPKLKFVITETGSSWVPPLLDQLDAVIENVRKGEIGELKYRAEDAIAKSATEYFRQNVYMGVSQPGPADAAVRTLFDEDRFMWGSDYPHDEGTGPYTTLHLRQIFHDVAPDTMRKVLAENPAKLYGFDLDKLAPLAEKYGPTVEEVAKPLTMAEMPAEPNSALRKGLGQTIA